MRRILSFWNTKNTSDDSIQVVVKDGPTKPDEVKKIYQQVLNESFTEREIELIRSAGGVRIIVMDLREDYTGEYRGLKNGRYEIAIPHRSIKKRETLRHETIHILQDIDDTRPEIDRHVFEDVSDDRDRKDRKNYKEATTEAEMLSRSETIDENDLGYYAFLGRGARWKKRKDHKLLYSRDNKDADQYGQLIQERFKETEISHLRYKKSKEAIKTRDDILEILKRKKNVRCRDAQDVD